MPRNCDTFSFRFGIYARDTMNGSSQRRTKISNLQPSTFNLQPSKVNQPLHSLGSDQVTGWHESHSLLRNLVRWAHGGFARGYPLSYAKSARHLLHLSWCWCIALSRICLMPTALQDPLIHRRSYRGIYTPARSVTRCYIGTVTSADSAASLSNGLMLRSLLLLVSSSSSYRGEEFRSRERTWLLLGGGGLSDRILRTSTPAP